RSATDVLPQASCAVLPASTAASTSSFVDLAISQNTFPVTGLTFSKYFPFAGALYSPLIKLSSRSLKLTNDPSVFGFAYLIVHPPHCFKSLTFRLYTCCFYNYVYYFLYYFFIYIFYLSLLYV